MIVAFAKVEPFCHSGMIELRTQSSKVYLLSNWKTIGPILKSSQIIDRSSSYRMFELWFGKGLFTRYFLILKTIISLTGIILIAISDGQQWKHDRKLLNSSFSYSAVNSFIPIIDKHAKVLVEVMRKELCSSQDTILTNIDNLLSLCALDKICGN